VAKGRHRYQRPPLWGRVLAALVCGLAAGVVGAAVVESVPPSTLTEPAATTPPNH
jgi:hypothetical protein